MTGMVCAGKYMLTRKSMTGFDVEVFSEDSDLIDKLCYRHFTSCRSEAELIEKADLLAKKLIENRENVLSRFFGDDE